jgi:hypothetical protein
LETLAKSNFRLFWDYVEAGKREQYFTQLATSLENLVVFYIHISYCPECIKRLGEIYIHASVKLNEDEKRLRMNALIL